MASAIPPNIQAVLALKSALRPVPDEVRKRVQSIRVRSAQEESGHVSWRRQAPQASGHSSFSSIRNTNSSDSSLNSRWRQSSGNLSQGAVSPTPGTPFRFSNTSPQAQGGNGPQGGAGFQRNASTGTFQSTPQTPISPATPIVPQRYMSKFHNGSKVGDDQILNTVILNKLNVFSVKTYDDVKAFLCQILGSDQKEFVREFTWLVFRKAAAEDKFCALFAKLLADIQRTYPVILEEMRNLHMTYLDIWDASESNPTKVDRRCRLGYSQFLAELTALQVLEVETMIKTLETLKGHISASIPHEGRADTVEEYIDCLKKLCGAKMSKEIRKVIADVLVADFTTWIDTPRDSIPAFSNKARYACMDLRDLLLKV